MRRLARTLPYLAVLLLLLVAVVALLRVGPLAEYVRQALVSEFSRQLGRDVSIGRASLTLSGSVSLRDVVVREADGSELLKAPLIMARVGEEGRWLPLLSRPTRVRGVRMVRPELVLRRRRSGEWNVADLLQRGREDVSRFQGEVVVEGGRVVIVDEQRGGLSTTLDDADVTLRYPRPDRIAIAVRGTGGEAFDELHVQSEADTRTGESVVTGSILNLDLAYGLQRAFESEVATVGAGRGDVEGRAVFGKAAADGRPVSYDVEMAVREAELRFPWLRDPVRAVHGKMRLIDGDLRLMGLSGMVAGAPIECKGVISDLTSPRLDLTLAASGIRYEQIIALLPSLALPVHPMMPTVGLPAQVTIPSPLAVRARVQGPLSDVRITGDVRMKTIEIGPVPWHDVLAEFDYFRGRFQFTGLRAHGSPRRVEGDLELDLTGERPSVRARGTLVHVPLTMLAQMLGIDIGGLEGTASVRLEASVAEEAFATGEFDVQDAAIRGIALGRIRGAFEVEAGVVRLTGCRVDGPAAAGSFEWEFGEDGLHAFAADLDRIDLSAAGCVLEMDALEGQCCATLEVSGEPGQGRFSGRVRLGPGKMRGYAFDRVETGFEVSPAELHVPDLRAVIGTGEYRGELRIADWQRGAARAVLDGHLMVSGVALSDWVPSAYGGLMPEALVDGTVVVAGTLADRIIDIDLRMSRPAVAGQRFETGRIRAGYHDHHFVIEEMYLEDGDSRLTATGTYSPSTGLAIDLRADPLALSDVGAELRRALGLAAVGELTGTAEMRGSLNRPRVSFRAAAGPLTLNELSFKHFSVAGTLVDGVVRLESCVLAQEDSSMSLSGELDRGAGTADMTLEIENFDVGTALMAADRAIWRLHRARVEGTGVTSPHFITYARIRDPVGGGRLSAKVHAVGPMDSMGVEVTGLGAEPGFRLSGLALNGWTVEHTEGRLSALLQARPQGGVSLHTAEIHVLVSHEMATALVDGTISPGGATDLSVTMENVDLQLVTPWLASPAGLGGTAAIFLDVSGPMRSPELRGDVFVEDLRIGGLEIEATRISPIRLEHGVLTLEEIWLRDGAMQGEGSAVFAPFSGNVGAPAHPPRGELHITKARSEVGTLPAVFDVDVYLAEDRLKISEDEAAEDPKQTPGIRGTLGEGTFRIGGEVVLRTSSPAGSDESGLGVSGDAVLGPSSRAEQVAENLPGASKAAWQQALRALWRRLDEHGLELGFDLGCEMNDVDLVVPGVLEGTLYGTILLFTSPESGLTLLATPRSKPLTLSNATLRVPREEALPSGPDLPFAPDVDVSVRVGDDVRFRHGLGHRETEITIDPGHPGEENEASGYLVLSGRLSVEALEVDGTFNSSKGHLAFPNGTLTLRRGTTWIRRHGGGPPRVTVSGEADGHVGEYYVSVRPVGQIYPFIEVEGTGMRIPPLALNAATSPPLADTYVMALLIGPVVAPVPGGRDDLTSLLVVPGQPGSGGAELTGVMLPMVGDSSGLHYLSLDVGVGGPLRLRLERLLGRVRVAYISSLTGATQWQRFRVAYEVTPLVSMGWSVDETERSRLEVQSFLRF